MGRPTTTQRYPLYFIDILNKLRDDPTKPVVMTLDSKASSLGFQLNFLSFRKAAVKEQWHCDHDVPDPDNPKRTHLVYAKYPDLNAYTTKRYPVNDAGQWVVEIWHMDYTAQALEWRKAFDSQNQLES